MSRRATSSAGARASRRAPNRVLSRDLPLGAVLGLAPAAAISFVEQTEYRTGAAALALLVVLGLALRWTVAAGAAPVLLLAMAAQVTDTFRDGPGGDGVAGVAVQAASMVVVLLALHRWEGDRRRAQREARDRMRNEQRLEALVDLAARLALVADRNGFYVTVERHLPATAGCDGAILVAAADGRVEFPAVAGHDPDVFPRVLPPGYVARGTPALDAMRTGEPVFCADGEELDARYPNVRAYREQCGHEAWAALPVAGMGALVLTWEAGQAFPPAQRAFLVTIANLLEAAAERIRSVEWSELERFVRAFDAMLDPVGIHRAVRDGSGAIVDLEIEYLNPATEALGPERAAVVGRRMSEVWPANPLFRAYLDVLEHGEPFILEEVEAAQLGATASSVTALSLRATRLDTDRLVVVVRDVSERTRLLHEIRQQNEVFAVAQRLAHVGHWSYDFASDRLEWSDELYRITGLPADQPPPRPGPDGSVAFEHPDDHGRVMAAVLEALHDRRPFSFEMRMVRQSDGAVREVVTSGTVLVDAHGRPAGVWGATQDVTEQREAERARRAVLDALARQREVVTELQRVILPDTLPTIPGAELSAHYRAAATAQVVGGDWYDAFETDDGRVVVSVGDVAGHGVECAALANQLRISVRVRAGDGMGPAQVLAVLDAELRDQLVTCWLGVYDPLTRVLRVANAGHLPALRCRHGRTELVAGHTRPPLGTGCGEGVTEHEIPLQPDDVVVVFTDGLVERRGEDLGVGFSRLEEMTRVALSTPEPAVTLVELLAPDAADDVCVVVLHVR